MAYAAGNPATPRLTVRLGPLSRSMMDSNSTWRQTTAQCITLIRTPPCHSMLCICMQPPHAQRQIRGRTAAFSLRFCAHLSKAAAVPTVARRHARAGSYGSTKRSGCTVTHTAGGFTSQAHALHEHSPVPTLHTSESSGLTPQIAFQSAATDCFTAVDVIACWSKLGRRDMR